ncbi:hypothetical protein BDZ90DRAFT_229938 [Jaminaea rosea]|uniref:CTLH domain-containing protein n=1 Tax=Jaminaea rosea TaxID=1569628 RepID=A0A316V064_9BASI|nr:hypothetical protein BDZ90DRAFT_229938 [Jaminaea rosea]PWN30947.1 hypothetical protein BDZ90DRAFT_229938 [Jaminaea rosea]
MDAISKEVERVAAKVPTLYASGSSSSSSSASSSAKKSSKAKAASPSGSSSTAAVSESLDSLLSSLETMRSTIASDQSPPSAPVVAAETKALIAKSQKAIADRQKDVYNALSKLGKAYDKKFPTPVDGIADPALFMGAQAQEALEAVVLDHMLRMGEWQAAGELAKESSQSLPPSDVYRQLDSISQAIEAGNLQPAIAWAESNRAFLSRRSSTFEFALHRSQFIRLATGQASPSTAPASAGNGTAMALDPDGENVPSSSSGYATPSSMSPVEGAIQYGRTHMRSHVGDHLAEIQALFSFALFLPYIFRDDPDADAASHITHLAHLRDLVPPNYHHFLDPIQVHAPYLVPLFQVDFCAINKLAREAPLKTAVEVGTGGALMKIMKVRQVMKQRGNEWSQANELPVRPNSSRLATLLFPAKG